MVYGLFLKLRNRLFGLLTKLTKGSFLKNDDYKERFLLEENAYLMATVIEQNKIYKHSYFPAYYFL